MIRKIFKRYAGVKPSENKKNKFKEIRVDALYRVYYFHNAADTCP